MPTPRHHRPAAAGAAALLSILGAACNADPVAPPFQTYAYVEVQAVEDPATAGVTTRPYAAFFRANNVRFPDSRTVADQCGTGPVAQNVPDPNIPAGFTYLEAGDPVTLTLSGPPRTLIRTPQTRPDGSVLFYQLPTTSGGFASNTDYTVSVPGIVGGFPAASLTGHTTAAFTIEAVPDSGAQTQTLPLRWSAAPTGHQSAMLAELRYTGTRSGVPTRLAIFCSLVDDGSFDVPASLAAEWFDAAATSHETIFQRLFTRISQGDGFVTVAASTYTVTKPRATPTAE